MSISPCEGCDTARWRWRLTNPPQWHRHRVVGRRVAPSGPGWAAPWAPACLPDALPARTTPLGTAPPSKSGRLNLHRYLKQHYWTCARQRLTIANNGRSQSPFHCNSPSSIVRWCPHLNLCYHLIRLDWTEELWGLGRDTIWPADSIWAPPHR